MAYQYGYQFPSYTNAPYGSEEYLRQQKQRQTAHLPPDPVLAQQKIDEVRQANLSKRPTNGILGGWTPDSINPASTYVAPEQRTAADVPSLGTGGPLTRAAMDASAGISQRPALSADGQPNYVMQQKPVLSIGSQNVTQPSNDAATTGPVLTPAQEEIIEQQEEQVTGDRRSQTTTGRMNPGHGYQKIPLHEKLIRMVSGW